MEWSVTVEISQDANAIIFGRCSSPTLEQKGSLSLASINTMCVFFIVLQVDPIVNICIHNATWNDYEVAKINRPTAGLT